MKNQNNKANSFQHKRQQQDTNKKRLFSYLQTLSKFPELIEHKTIAQGFEVSNYQGIFKQEAIRRLIERTAIKPKTASTLTKETGINQKYICRLKVQLVNEKRLFVAYTGKCPTTLSRGVQFLSSDKSYLLTTKANIDESN
ncbi:hypothetical protein [Chryseobacterium sp.]|uniref:hypothetical protein n=1 Tax=Chryseobacterium sp. TaxID=1871047 RepID=UPI00289CA37A|nr:hypothetical protein [Chryseobacterium sp.]